MEAHVQQRVHNAECARECHDRPLLQTRASGRILTPRVSHFKHVRVVEPRDARAIAGAGAGALGDLPPCSADEVRCRDGGEGAGGMSLGICAPLKYVVGMAKK